MSDSDTAERIAAIHEHAAGAEAHLLSVLHLLGQLKAEGVDIPHATRHAGAALVKARAAREELGQAFLPFVTHD